MKFQTFSQISDIDLAIDKSSSKMQVFFKHSTVCPISRMAYEKFQNEYPLSDEQVDVYYIGVIEERPLSNYIAEKLGVQHESPQMIVIKNGKQVFNESHLMINPKSLLEFI